MRGCTGMFARVPVGRAVAAQRGAALLACPEVHPARADLDALLALVAAGKPGLTVRGTEARGENGA